MNIAFINTFQFQEHKAMQIAVEAFVTNHTGLLIPHAESIAAKLRRKTSLPTEPTHSKSTIRLLSVWCETREEAIISILNTIRLASNIASEMGLNLIFQSCIASDVPHAYISKKLKKYHKLSPYQKKALAQVAVTRIRIKANNWKNAIALYNHYVSQYHIFEHIGDPSGNSQRLTKWIVFSNKHPKPVKSPDEYSRLAKLYAFEHDPDANLMPIFIHPQGYIEINCFDSTNQRHFLAHWLHRTQISQSYFT